MPQFTQYKLNNIINKTTKSVQQSLGRNFVQKNITELTAIVDNKKQNELQNLLDRILMYQKDFIDDINILQALEGEEILSSVFGAKDINNTSLNLTNLFNQDQDIKKIYAYKGLSDYLAFKDAAINAFMANLDLQEKIHTNTKFYDMIAINGSNGQTNLFMLDTKGLTDFMKNTNFIDFIPTGLKDKAGTITGTITDFQLTLNTSVAKEDVLLKYFQSKVNQANSGFYQLDDTVAGQIFQNKEYKTYMTNEYSNNPRHNKGILMEPVLNKLLQGHSMTDIMDNTKSNLYQVGNFQQKQLDSKTGKALKDVEGNNIYKNVDYKLNIAPGTFGGAIGDAIGHAFFKEGNGQNKNLFSFITEGRPTSTNGWDYKLVNTQIKTINFNAKTQQTSSVSWGSLSSIYQNTAIYADSNKFNNAIGAYTSMLQNTAKMKEKEVKKRIRIEVDYFFKSAQSISDEVKEAVRQSQKDYLLETFTEWATEEMLDEIFNSVETENNLIGDISDAVSEDLNNELESSEENN